MSDQHPEDRELIASLAGGDARAFDVLARRHLPAMQRAARYLVGTESLAADVVQEALLSIFRSATTYDPRVGDVRPWLLSITRNAARRARRAERLVPVEEVEDLTSHDQTWLALGREAGWGDTDPERNVRRLEDADLLARLVATLPEDEREALVLRDIEGLDGAEAATVLGVTLAAMKSRLHRARLHLMQALRRSQRGEVMADDRNVGGLRCSEVLARLSDFFDGDLPASEIAAIKEHVSSCTVCEQFGGRFAHTVSGLRRSLGAAPSVDEALVARLRDQLRGT